MRVLRARGPVVLKANLVVSQVFGRSSVLDLRHRLGACSAYVRPKEVGARQHLSASRYHLILANFLIVMHAIAVISSS